MTWTDPPKNAESVPMLGQELASAESARRYSLWQEHINTTPVLLYAMQDQGDYQVSDGIESGPDFTSRYLRYNQGSAELFRIYALDASIAEQASQKIWFQNFQTELPPLKSDHGTDLIVNGLLVHSEMRSTDSAWLLVAALGEKAVLILGQGAIPQQLRLKRANRISEALHHS